MSLIKSLMEKPTVLSSASKFTVLNGCIYLGSGALLLAWPAAVQNLLMDPAFAGHEEALMRVIGLTVGVIGWLYLFGGRTGAQQFVAASVIDRLLLPVVLIPLILAGVFPHTLSLFAVLDPALAVVAWVLLKRKT